MNTEFTVFNLSDGKIIRTGICPAEDVNLQVQSPSEKLLIGSADDLTQYVDRFMGIHFKKNKFDLAGAIAVSKEIVNADGVDTISISGLPRQSFVKIVGPTTHVNGVVDDGILELTFDAEGNYKIVVTAFPYLDKIIQVSAV